MLIHRAYCYELDPNQNQQTLLAKHAGAARFAYNWGLAKRIELWEKEKRVLMQWSNTKSSTL